MKHVFELFCIGFIQIVTITISTWQMANKELIGAMVTSFIVAIVWAVIVKRLSIGNWKDRIIYAFGSSIGVATGIFLTQFLYG